MNKRKRFSHREARTSLESKGLAVYDPDGESWTITEKGRLVTKAI